MAERDARGRFAKGNSGKPKGAKHKKTLTREQLAAKFRAAAEAVTIDVLKKLGEMAKDGDTTAARLILDRTFPVWSQKEMELMERIEALEKRLLERQPGRPVASLHPLDARRQQPPGPPDAPSAKDGGDG